MLSQACIDQIKKHYSSSYSITYSKTLLTSSMRNTMYDELSSSKYADRQILQQYIEAVEYISHYVTPHFQINIWISNDQKGTVWDAVMNRVCKRLETLYTYFQSSKAILFYDCIPVDITKHIPEDKQKCISTENINGGYTYLNGNRVVLFRKEELPKVMLHEYLHQVQGNADIRWSNDQLRDLYHLWDISFDGCSDTSMYKCSTDLRINEAFVELWALCFQVLFVAIDSGIDLQKIYDEEYAFSCCQARKVYEHQRMCSPDKRWVEDTHSFSYHLVKTFLLWLVKNHHIPLESIHLNTYNSTVIVRYIHSYWEQYINAVIKNRRVFKCQNGLYGASTLRMTLFGDF